MKNMTVFDKETLNFVNSHADDKEVAIYLFSRLEQNDGGLSSCVGCFWNQSYGATLGGQYLGLSNCPMHGSSERTVLFLKRGLNASQQNRAEDIERTMRQLLPVSGQYIRDLNKRIRMEVNLAALTGPMRRIVEERLHVYTPVKYGVYSVGPTTEKDLYHLQEVMDVSFIKKEE